MEGDVERSEFAPLRIKRVVRETADAVSLVLDVPEHCSQRFRYQAGQFLTLQVEVAGDHHRRCYSMSSSPHSGDDLQITVKRDPGGLVSNWLNDIASAGREIHAAPPEGRFVLAERDRDIVAFAGGSGITPIFSLIGARWRAHRGACGCSMRTAPRIGDLRSVAAALCDTITPTGSGDTSLRRDAGVVASSAVEEFVGAGQDVDYYVCGPRAFMDTVEASVLASGVPRDRLHLERFEVATADPGDTTTTATEEVVDRAGPSDHHRGLPRGRHPAAAARRPA